MTLLVGSLFSGIGGIDQGFGAAGFEVAWQCESNPDARAILTRQWPGTPCHEDVREIDGSIIPAVDIITAGFPCQDLSVAGGRIGLAGNRSGLFFEIPRIVLEMRDATNNRSPAFVVLENVPGLYSSHRGRDFAVVLRALAECGALDISWRVLDAQYFGVPQRRRRVFIVADFRAERAGQVLFEPESGRRDFATRAQSKKRIAAPITAGSHGPGVSRPGRHIEDDYNLVAHNLTSHHKRLDPNGEDFVVAHTLRSEGCDASEDGTGRGVPLIPVCPGGNTDESYWKVTDVANTVAAGQFPWQGTRIATPSNPGVRRLTPRETERLQGLEDDWTEGFSDTTRYTLIGNSVAVPVITWIAQRMKDALGTD